MDIKSSNTLPNQGKAINAFNAYALLTNNDSTPPPLLNDNGVCMPLSLIAAHCDLTAAASGAHDHFFTSFLTQLSTSENIQEFFDNYDLIQQTYLEALRTDDRDSADALYEQLRDYQKALAYLDLMILYYAPQSAEYHLKAYAKSVTPLTISYAGLDYASRPGFFHINMPDLKDFFFGSTTVDTPVLCPFSAGKTYLIIYEFESTPGHACQLTVSSDGKLKYYDPNYKNYVEDIEDFSTYMEFFKNTYFVNEKSLLDISVFPVRLSRKASQEQEHDKSDEQFDNAKLAQLSQSPALPLELRVVMLFCAPSCAQTNESLKALVTSDNNPLDVVCLALKTLDCINNRDRLKELLERYSLSAAEYARFLEHAISLRLQAPTIGWLLKQAPETFRLHSETLVKFKGFLHEEILRGLDDHAQELINCLLSCDQLKTTYPALFDAPSINTFLIEAWLSFQQDHGLIGHLDIEGVSLLKFMLKNNLSDHLIQKVLRSWHYELSEQDYRTVLTIGSMAFKDALLSRLQQQPGRAQFQENLLLTAVSFNNGEQLSLLLENQSESINPSNLQDLALCLVVNHNTSLLNLFLASDQLRDCDKKELASWALCYSLLRAEPVIGLDMLSLGATVLSSQKEFMAGQFSASIPSDSDDLLKLWVKLGTAQPEIFEILSKEGQCLLTEATSAGNTALIKKLLNAGARLEHQNHLGLTALMIAIEKGDFDTVTLLLEHAEKHGQLSTLINQKDQLGRPVLSFSHEKFNRSIIEKLIKAGADVKSCDSQGGNLLAQAAMTNNMLALNFWLTYERNWLNQPDSHGNTPIMAAIASGRTAQAIILLKEGADLHLKNHAGLNALTIKNAAKESFLGQAIKNYHNTETVLTLLEHGASLEDCDAEHRHALFIALEGLRYTQSTLMVETIMAHSQNLESLKDNNGSTLLMHAATQIPAQSIEVFSKILSATKASINDKNSNGDTALICAIKTAHGPDAKVLALINAGISAFCENAQGETALLLASYYLKPDTIQELLKDPSLLQQQNSAGDSNLMLAFKNDEMILVVALINAGADLTICNKAGESVLSTTQYDGSNLLMDLLMIDDIEPSIITRILPHFDTNYRDVTGATALIYAAQFASPEITKLIAEHSSEVIDALDDEDGATALHHAISQEKIENVRILSAYSSLVNKENRDGLSPLLLALDMGQADMVKILIEAGASLATLERKGKSFECLLEESTLSLIEKEAIASIVAQKRRQQPPLPGEAADHSILYRCDTLKKLSGPIRDR